YDVSLSDLQLTDEQIEDFREAFGLFDREGKGSITVDDLKAVLRSLGKNPSDEELVEMIREVDDDGERHGAEGGRAMVESGTIEFPEFLTMMVRKVKAPETEKELIDAFRVFDHLNNGFVSVTEMRHVLANLGERLTVTEINELCRVADAGGVGQVNYVDFVKTMSL
ncbi:CALM-like protein, partial [Mya arenaria]